MLKNFMYKRTTRHLFLMVGVLLSVGALSAAWLLATSPEESGASSHREAPLLAGDPTVDNVDVYAFVSPDKTDSVTLIATWIPFEDPAGGPNFYHFDPNARYLIKIDQDGNAIEDITYEWTFSKPTPQNNKTFLYNTNQIGADYDNDADFNVRQNYTVTRITGDTLAASTTVLFSNELVPPDNIGPRSTPNYAAIAANAVNTAGSIKEFTGQRDDPFYVDLGAVFDLLGLRPFNTLHAVSLPTANGIDFLQGFNVHATTIQVPISDVTSNCDGTATDTDCVIGVWSTAERRSTITYSAGAATGSGPFVQISRLGQPLVNEVVMSLELKDTFNAVAPVVDSTVPAVVARVTDPEAPALMNTLYSALATIDKTGRDDLVTVFLTGIPGVNQQAGSAAKPSEQLRLNTSIKPTKAACQGDRLGLFNNAAADTPTGDDLTAFPNGRRLEDDVTDMALRAVAQGYGGYLNGAFSGAVPTIKNLSPNNTLGDGVDGNDVACLSNFPYMGTPHAGYENNHGGLFGRFFPFISKN